MFCLKVWSFILLVLNFLLTFSVYAEELQLNFDYVESDSSGIALGKVINAFSKEYPNVSVKIGKDINSYKNCEIKMLNSGLLRRCSEVANCAVKGYCNVFKMNPKVVEKLSPVVLERVSYLQKPFFVPFKVYYSSLFYKKSILKKHGISTSDLETFSSFEKVLSKLKKAKVGALLFPGELSWQMDFVTMALIQTLSPPELQSSPKSLVEVPKISEDFLRHYEILNSFAAENPRKLDVRVAAKKFVSSEVAFLISATYPLDEIGALKNNSDIGVVLFPRINFPAKPIYYFDGLAFGGKCEGNKICHEFGNYLLSDTSQKIMVDHVGGIPPGKQYNLGRMYTEFEEFGLKWMDYAPPRNLYCLTHFLSMTVFEMETTPLFDDKVKKMKEGWRNLSCIL